MVSGEDLAPCLACVLNPDSYLCIPDSSSCLLPVQDFLVLLVSCWRDASTLAQIFRNLSISFVCFVLFLLLLIFLVLLVLLVKLFQCSICKLLLSFPSLVGGWTLIESICYSVYCRPALNVDRFIGAQCGVRRLQSGSEFKVRFQQETRLSREGIRFFFESFEEFGIKTGRFHSPCQVP